MDSKSSFVIERYDSLPSTNSLAREKILTALNTPLPPTVILCRSQSQGRGTNGRSWISLSGNLMTSIILPLGDTAHTGDLALVAGLGVAVWVKARCLAAKVAFKWPNDILINGDKCGGILIEIEPPYVIFGLGLNLAAAPASLEKTTCVNRHTRSPLTVEQALPSLLETFSRIHSAYQEHGLSYLIPELMPFMVEGR